MRSLTWISDSELEIEGLRFQLNHESTHSDIERPDAILMMKHGGVLRQLLDRLSREAIEHVVEIGVLRGGSLAFWHRLFEPKSCLGLDIGSDLPDQLAKYMASEYCSTPVPVFAGGTDQGDGVAVRSHVERAPSSRWIDVVIDDASHAYEPTRACFEAVFPYLRPNGVYVIEDWAGAHWSTPGWKRQLAQAGPGISLTSLIVELIAVSANHPLLIKNVEVWPGFVLVTRGEQAFDGESFSVDDHVTVLGRRFIEVPLPPAECALVVNEQIGLSQSAETVLGETIARMVAAERRAESMTSLSDARELSRLATESHSQELTRLLIERSTQLTDLSEKWKRLHQEYADLADSHRAALGELDCARAKLSRGILTRIARVCRRAFRQVGRQQ